MTPEQRPYSKPIEILLVEDNAGDVRLISEALKEGRLRKNLHVASNGLEAMAFLRRQGSYADAPRPDLVLLDLNLPKKDGREVLEEIRADDDLGDIPVIVLTSSTAEQDVQQAYDLQANCYITKPMDLGEFFAAVQTIETFWLKFASQ